MSGIAKLLFKGSWIFELLRYLSTWVKKVQGWLIFGLEDRQVAGVFGFVGFRQRTYQVLVFCFKKQGYKTSKGCMHDACE